MFVSPAVAGDHVYVASCSGTVFAFAADDGTLMWTYDTAADGRSAQFHGELLVAGDLLVAGADGRPTAHLYAFVRETGTVRWRRAFAGGVAVDVVRDGERLLATSMAGEVFAVDLASGETVWSVDEPPAGGGWTRPLDPALAGGRLVVPWRTGVVEAFDARSGERLWRRDLGVGLTTSVVVDAVVGDAVAVGEGVVWVGAADGTLRSLALADGAAGAVHPLGGMPYGDPMPAGRCLLALHLAGAGDTAADAATSPHAVSCVDPRSGKALWRHEVSGEWGTFRPLVTEGIVVVGIEGRLLGLALDDGTLAWERPVAGLPRGLGRSGDRLFVGAFGGEIFAMPWPHGPAGTSQASGSPRARPRGGRPGA